MKVNWSHPVSAAEKKWKKKKKKSLGICCDKIKQIKIHIYGKIEKKYLNDNLKPSKVEERYKSIHLNISVNSKRINSEIHETDYNQILKNEHEKEQRRHQ